MTIKVVVACTNAGGSPDFYFCLVNCDEVDYAEGNHYDAAIQAAVEEGYEVPAVAFDENDDPRWLFEHFVWKSASKVDVP